MNMDILPQVAGTRVETTKVAVVKSVPKNAIGLVLGAVAIITYSL